MKRILVVLVAASLLTSCVANRAALNQSLQSRSAARTLELGMSKEAVLLAMGEPEFMDRELSADGEAIERLKWLTNYDHHIYTVVTTRADRVVAITEEEGPAP
ncbi:MAG TPA: hypothetical protein VMS56_04920 [Thermoanaerobaculia bacterium]|nr:hypothetical protein [Thermoanaerobaculia bacterium]